MADTYTSALNMTKPESGSTSGWGDSLNANFGVLDTLSTPENVYFVSPAFTSSALGNGSASDRRHFDTVQGAITAAQGTSFDHRAVIYLWPGQYEENLVITGSVTLAAVHRNHWGFHGGARSVCIKGVDTVQSPTVTINQQDDESIAVNFVEMCLENDYNQANSGLIDKAQILEFNSNAPNFHSIHGGMVSFTDCAVRAQTWGDNNDWQAAIRMGGFSTISMMGCQYGSWAHAGGENNGGIARVIDIQNDSGTPYSQSSQVYIKDCDFRQTYAGASASPCLVYADNGVIGGVYDSSIFQEGAVPFVDGGTGTNNVKGLEAGDFNAFPYCNSLGINKVKL
jgi:hypothetical protein